ncbi:MAG TPA: hypothetical protein VMH90_01060 [Thermoplasmata archaeon]|nr:hypothetical protein [Thermoplasmata archaeon]
MAARKNSKPKVRHDPRKWALQVLQSAGSGVSVPTSVIVSKASALGGAKIPYHSIYGALRTLVRRGRLTVRRKGRERVYRLAGPVPAVAPPRRRRRAAAAAAPAPAAPAPKPSAPAIPLPPGLHKIAPGEIALLHVGATHVETAANIEGQLVLKRHPRP